MAKLKSYGMLTSGEISQAEHNDKFLVADGLRCPFCEGRVQTQISQRGNELPFCYTCGVFLNLVWEIRQNQLQVRFAPRTKDVGAGENEILQSTGDDIQLSSNATGHR